MESVGQETHAPKGMNVSMISSFCRWLSIFSAFLLINGCVSRIHRPQGVAQVSSPSSSLSSTDGTTSASGTTGGPTRPPPAKPTPSPTRTLIRDDDGILILGGP